MHMLLHRHRATFDGVVRDHVEDMYRYAYWLCRSRWAAEDLLQEALVRAWRGWAGLREPRTVKSWLFTILYHEFARQAAKPRAEWVEPETLPEPSTDSDPGTALDLGRALGALSDDSRHALLLQVLGGFSCAEIAGVLGSTEGAVMTRLSRARQALRRALEPQDFGKEAKEA
ncbi:MAG: sigma-70 family RNA polymerase sigma factor [Pseudomonadota bacterium]